MARWCFGHTDELLKSLGFEHGWWCGLSLARADLFGDDSSGDVDLIAGPVRLQLSKGEWQARLSAANSKYTSQLAVAMAIHDACEDGLIEWPPPVELIIACEFKASYFRGRWRATHTSTGALRRIKGQLKYLVEKGVDLISFAHLGAVAASAPGEPNLVSIEQRLDDAWGSFPCAFEPDDMPGIGYFKAAMAAAPDVTEEFGGVHSWLEAIRAPGLQPSAVQNGDWRSNLRAKLSQLPRPRYFRTFILPCQVCGTWRHSATADQARVPCSCGGSSR